MGNNNSTTKMTQNTVSALKMNDKLVTGSKRIAQILNSYLIEEEELNFSAKSTQKNTCLFSWTLQSLKTYLT